MGAKFMLEGPFQVEVKVRIISDDLKQSGIVTLSMGYGKYASKESIKEAIERFENEEMPEGFSLMTKKQFWDVICKEHYGDYGYAIPGGEEWNKSGE